VKVQYIAIAFLEAFFLPALLQAQISFNVAQREVQIHGFLSEGFASSNDNNYLTMGTSSGSFFTELGTNISSKLTDKLRVGGQAYGRDIGELGDGKVYLDWASADFRWKDWLGVRAGKVKTTVGLYTDTQDQEFLHTWALLPQSVYPIDLRSITVAHVGGDIYGTFGIKRAGSLSYTVFSGSLPSDPRGGFVYGLAAQGLKLRSDIKASMTGIDLRWTAPKAGLMAGAALDYGHASFDATRGASPLPLSYSTKTGRTTAFYGQYTLRNFQAEAEYRHQTRRAEIDANTPAHPAVAKPGSDEPAWFVSGAYRFSKWMEIGSYYSHYHVTLINPVTPVTGIGRDHVYDKSVTVRFDLTQFFDFKIEGHFMNGVGSPALAHGFYPQQNPQGFLPNTNMLVIRTGLYF